MTHEDALAMAAVDKYPMNYLIELFMEKKVTVFQKLKIISKKDFSIVLAL